jgi:hypothetical protein
MRPSRPNKGASMQFDDPTNALEQLSARIIAIRDSL